MDRIGRAASAYSRRLRSLRGHYDAFQPKGITRGDAAAPSKKHLPRGCGRPMDVLRSIPRTCLLHPNWHSHRRQHGTLNRVPGRHSKLKGAHAPDAHGEGSCQATERVAECLRCPADANRYEDPRDFHTRVYPHQDTILHYGQRFRLSCHSSLGVEPTVSAALMNPPQRTVRLR